VYTARSEHRFPRPSGVPRSTARLRGHEISHRLRPSRFQPSVRLRIPRPAGSPAQGGGRSRKPTSPPSTGNPAHATSRTSGSPHPSSTKDVYRSTPEPPPERRNVSTTCWKNLNRG